MPSAASVKVEKQQVSPEGSLPDAGGPAAPLRQVITLVEHKIRNLEKRKGKLESYRDMQNAGKELNSDQKTAVAKYNEVTQTLEFAREIYKQFLGIAVVTEKEAKKQAKKEQAAKNQAELARLREILLVQDALNQMGNEVVRDDFLHGRNGAAQLTEADLKLLDDLYPAVTPKHESGNPTAFTNEVQTAAEHLLAVVDGKPKEVFGGTYSQVKEILGKIHESGYFDQAAAAPVAEDAAAYEPLPEEPVEEAPIAVVEQQLPPMEMLSMENQAPIPPGIVLAVAPEPVEVEPIPVEPIYYQQPPQQPLRPISEMLGPGNFFFLQDSELDTPPEQIPSQTFTNQAMIPPMFQAMPPVPQQPIVPQQAGNNGMVGKGDEHKEEIKGKGPRPNNQSYYQMNNGYNKRPRQNRNNGNSGPRPNNAH